VHFRKPSGEYIVDITPDGNAKIWRAPSDTSENALRVFKERHGKKELHMFSLDSRP
jgi:hypothetical protein